MSAHADLLDRFFILVDIHFYLCYHIFMMPYFLVYFLRNLSNSEADELMVYIQKNYPNSVVTDIIEEVTGNYR